MEARRSICGKIEIKIDRRKDVCYTIFKGRK